MKQHYMLEMRRKKPIPYAFVLELLAAQNPYTKPMFGCTAVYIDDRIVVILRERESYPEDNGIWLATSREHHESLRKLFPKMRSLACFGLEDKPTGWQVLPAEAADFEEKAELACELILQGDPRIGKVPARKKPKQKKIAAKKLTAAQKKMATVKAKPRKKPASKKKTARLARRPAKK